MDLSKKGIKKYLSQKALKKQERSAAYQAFLNSATWRDVVSFSFLKNVDFYLMHKNEH